MIIHDVEFKGSFTKVSSCPSKNWPEYAFIGRSNVGKSSLINMLTGRREIAKVSKVPGKTQLINYFAVNDSWHLVDLPGYGYAKISKKKRAEWEDLINNYLLKRENLVCAFVLLDSRLPLQNNDLEFINWLGKNQIPFNIIYTKCDKLKKQNAINRNITRIQKGLLEYWTTLPTQFMTSSSKGWGRPELLNYIKELNETWEN